MILKILIHSVDLKHKNSYLNKIIELQNKFQSYIISFLFANIYIFYYLICKNFIIEFEFLIYI
jgi:hypothetical protein